MRKLASIGVVNKPFPIEGADIVEAGWVCIAKKGEFQAIDTNNQFEIDIFLPLNDTHKTL